ncbi:uncharacterized protein LOC128962892 [Oppia nitens]|uniref:uncharacterized protein LOC128962892 n=1 Tax=Oppia nitens TaxID=1686743 RepID=UPI0023DC024B|nr:uncharacterized protein LOC128962892 [Oppia nitens]
MSDKLAANCCLPPKLVAIGDDNRDDYDYQLDQLNNRLAENERRIELLDDFRRLAEDYRHQCRCQDGCGGIADKVDQLVNRYNAFSKPTIADYCHHDIAINVKTSDRSDRDMAAAANGSQSSSHISLTIKTVKIDGTVDNNNNSGQSITGRPAEKRSNDGDNNRRPKKLRKLLPKSDPYLLLSDEDIGFNLSFASPKYTPKSSQSSSDGQRDPYRKSVGRPKIKCCECNVSFKTNDKLLEHIKSVHESGQHNVSDCPPRTTPPPPLIKTTTVVVADDSDGGDGRPTNSFGCEHCTEQFGSNEKLLVHLSDSHSIESFVCHLCPFKTITRVALNEHKIVQHNVTRNYRRIDIDSDLASVANDYDDDDDNDDSYEYSSQLSNDWLNPNNSQTSGRSLSLKTTNNLFKKSTGICNLVANKTISRQLPSTGPIVEPIVGQYGIRRSHAHRNFGQQFEQLIKSETSSTQMFVYHGIDDDMRCPYCGCEPYTEIQLDRHIRLVHNEVQPQVCDKCAINFYVESTFRKHMLALHSKQ